MKKNFTIILFLVIILGAYLRFYKLGNNSFVADEFLDINSSYAYFKTGVWQNWDFNFGKVNTGNVFETRDERAWIYKWQVAELFKIFPPTEGVARSVSALWGVFTILLVYWAAFYFTKKRTIGILSAFLFAVSIGGIELDRRLRMYAMFLPVYLIFSWFFYKFLEEKYNGKFDFFRKVSEKWGLNLLFLLPALLFGIISFLTHQLTVNFAAVAAIYLAIWAVWNYKKDKKFSYKYLGLLAAGIIGLIVAVIFYPEEVRSNLKELQLFNNHWEYFGIIFRDYSHGAIAIIFLILGIYYIFKKQKMPKEGSWLAISFFVPLLMAAFFWSQNVGEQYVFFIKPFEIILIASGIYAVAKFFELNLANYGKKAYLSTIILVAILLPNYAYFFEKNNTYHQTAESDNPNYRKIFTYVKKYQKPSDVIITRNFRNYYLSGAKIPVYDFGGELAKEKLSLADMQKISSENASGWFIISTNDDAFIANDAMIFVEKNFEKVSNVAVRGQVKVYRW